MFWKSGTRSNQPAPVSRLAGYIWKSLAWTAVPGIILAVVTARPAPAAEEALSPAQRSKIIDTVAARIAKVYVLPELALQMESSLRSRTAAHGYDAIHTTCELCNRLTQDLRQISGDQHLEVIYREKADPKEGTLNGVGRTTAEQTLAGKLTNFGFDAVSRMDGNVGYLKLREFYPVEGAYETAAAAMSFLRHTDALIIDLRDNPGGTLDMNALLSTYLLGRKLIHLNGVRGREVGQVGELWTMPQAPGLIYTRPVYLLTNRQTFSQAEAFAYQLQQLKRATVVGERTGGGAHLVEFESIAEHVVLRLPKGRFVHPVTLGNWQGVGVNPDIETASEDPLSKAYLLALTTLQRENTDQELRPAYERLVNAAQRALESSRRTAPRAGK